jgi:signal transduction histidine kinase
MKNSLVVTAVCFWLITSPLFGHAQKRGPELIDSLEKEVARPGEDTNKVLTLMRLSGAWAVIDLNKAFPAVNKALLLAEKLNWLKGIANSENNLGLFLSDTGNVVGARQHFERSYKLNVQRDSKINVVNNLVNIGRTWSYESDFPKAIDYFFEAKTIAEEIKSDQKMALVGNNLASNFVKQRDFQKALTYGQYTLEHAAKGDDPASMGKGLTFMGNAEAALNDTAAAIRWLDSAIAVDKRAGLKVDLSDVLGDRALVESNPGKRLQMELDAEKLMAEVNPNSTGHMIEKGSIGYDYFLLAKEAATTEKPGLLKKADEYLGGARAIAEKRNNPARLAELLIRIVEIEEYEGKYKEALADHKRMMTINDSLFSQENKNKIAGMEVKHTVELKDAELTVSQLKLSNQRKTTIALIAGLAGLAVFGGLLYRQSRSRKKANAALQKANLELEEANRVKARFFGILSHDLRAPVASLLHFLEIQKEAPDLMNAEQQTAHRSQISDSAENLLNTMEGMLLWSKQQMQSFQPRPKDTPVNELFEYIRKFVGEPEKVTLLFQPADGISVFTDENYLRVMMQNLTSNAISALKDRPDSKIQWKAEKQNGRTILSIADNGPGLGSERSKALYGETVADNGREGFGLHIIRDLAKAIQCKIDVRSDPGKGTVFTLTF